MPSSEASPPSTGGKDRRAFVRYHSRPETPLFAIGGPEEIHSWKAKVRDISQGGISLHVTSPFEVGAVVDIELWAPGSDSARTLIARVVRVEAMESPIFLVACAFDMPLSNDELKKIAEEQAEVTASG